MKFAGRLRKKLNGSINRICTKHSSFFVSPDKDFTRKGKFKPQDIFMSLLSMEGSSLSHELLNYFQFSSATPSNSAFVQARSKISPSAFEDLFYDFSNNACGKELSFCEEYLRLMLKYLLQLTSCRSDPAGAILVPLHESTLHTSFTG